MKTLDPHPRTCPAVAGARTTAAGTGASAGLRFSNVRVVDVAPTPTSPITPNIPQNLMLGLLLGLAAGIGQVLDLPL